MSSVTRPNASREARRIVTSALLAAAALICVAGACPRAGRAQSTSVPGTLAGTWAHDGDLARAARTVDTAFAPSIARLPEMLHGFARERVRSNMDPPRRILVSVAGSRIRVTLEAGTTRVIDGALGSAATTSGVEEGTRVTPRLSGGWLDLVYEGEGSQLRQLFSTEPDGARMHVDYSVTSPQLAGPVRFRLEYVRR